MKTQDVAPRGGVYLLRIGPRKYYFGIAVNFARRRSVHLSELRRGVHDNPILQASYNKHGERSFRFEPIVRCSREAAAKTEAWLIQSCESDDNCANLRIEDGTTYSHSDETRRKISDAKRGKSRSEETRRKLSEASKQREPASEETRRKIGEASRRRKPASEETRRKIAEAKRGKPRSEETRRKLSEATKASMTPEHRRKLSMAAKRRKPASEEARRNMSEAQLGRSRSEETCRKMSEAAKRRWAAHRAAKANQVAECE